MNFIKKSLIRTAVYYTVCAVFFSILIMIIYADSEDGQNLSALRTFLLLPFSLCFGIANTLLSCERPGVAMRWTLHCILTVLSSYLCIILPATIDDRGSEKLVGFLTVLVLYVFGAVIFAVVKSRFKKLAEEEKQFSKKSRR